MQTLGEIQNQLHKAHDVIDEVFRSILPKYGLGVREAQVQLSHNMLDALHDRNIALTDAGVGIGKTYAYLVAVIVQHIYITESWWVRTSYRHDAMFNMDTPMPVIISTSSIALQKAIVNEYIPFLSKVLMESGIIQIPLKYVVRKGKSNYVCDKLLRQRLNDVNLEQKNPQQRDALLTLSSVYDLDKVQGLSAHDRKQVCVPSCCSKKCKEASKCRYQRFLQLARSPSAFFQICNHNYLLADTLHRRTGKEPLLPNYKALIIDEAHKLHDAAQQMYSHVLVEDDIQSLINQASNVGMNAKKYVKQLLELEKDTNDFFTALSSCVVIDPDEDVQRFDYSPTKDMKAKLFTLIMSTKVVLESLESHARTSHAKRFEAMKDKLYLFYRQEAAYVRYVEYSPDCKSLSLCAVPKNLKKQFSDDLWSMPVPFILTSGTLAVNGNFSRTRKLLGMDGSTAMRRIVESIALSPFDYQKNSLLHLPNDLPYPDADCSIYLDSVSKKIVELIHATHGHTLVLFTSYKTMSEVGKLVQMQSLSIPLLVAWKDDRQTINAFKEAGNAVLFATGSCWEGVDFPGDMVSSLIVVTLPFNVPDPLSRYEQSLFSSFADYLAASVVPDMQKKLKQGFGRAIRTETDTCVVTLFDSRSRTGGKFYNEVLDTLPRCQITCEISDVTTFIKRVKPSCYFSSYSEGI